MQTKLKPADVLLALVVVAIWGTNFVVIRWGLDELPPFAFVALRFLFCAFPLFLFMRRPRVPVKWLALFGLFLGPGQFALLFLAMRGDISPGLASLVIQVQVFFTIGMSALFFHERVSRIGLGAMALAVAGLAVVGVHGDASLTLTGLVLVLGAALCWACANIVVKRMSRDAAQKPSQLAFVAWSSLFALPPLLLLALLEGPARDLHAIANASPRAWLSVAWQAAGNTLFGYVAWNRLLARYPSAVVAPYALLVPVFGMGASALVLGEPLPAWKLLGAALVIAGIGAIVWEGLAKARR